MRFENEKWIYWEDANETQITHKKKDIFYYNGQWHYRNTFL